MKKKSTVQSFCIKLKHRQPQHHQAYQQIKDKASGLPLAGIHDAAAQQPADVLYRWHEAPRVVSPSPICNVYKSGGSNCSKIHYGQHEAV